MTDLESFAFGDSPALADELLDLVLTAKKTATCWAASEGDKGVEVGKRWIVKDGQGRPRAILETVEVERRQFEDVDAALRLRRGRGRPVACLLAPGAHGLFHPARRVSAGDGGLLRAVQAGRGHRGRVRTGAKEIVIARSEATRRSRAVGRRLHPLDATSLRARDDDRPLYPSTNSLRGIPCAYRSAVRSAWSMRASALAATLGLAR